MNIINNNPYRQLGGVYSTSSQRDVIANQGKIKAFLKVDKQVFFPLDLNEKNDSNDTVAHKAMILQSYAQSIVVGKMVKDCCNKCKKV